MVFPVIKGLSNYILFIFVGSDDFINLIFLIKTLVDLKTFRIELTLFYK